MLASLVGRAVLAGLGAGLIAGGLQLGFVQPVLLEAELYESGMLTHHGTEGAGMAHHHGLDVARDAVTVAFTVLTYVGWALVLAPLMDIAERRGARIDARHGVVWGVAGFVVALLAPAFGAPPGLPGSASVAIELRQAWWLGTVLSTASALWLLAFVRHRAAAGVAIVLLAAPHVVGLPEPEVYLGPAPPELGALMATRVLGVGLAAWVCLGALAGALWNWRARPALRTA